MKRHSKIVAIQGDSLKSINRKTDTTLLLALEAQRRGYKIYYYETKSLTLVKDKIYALSKEVEFYENKKKFYFLEKNFNFKNFSESQKFVNEVGNIAETEKHHPDIIFGWGYAKIKIFTHKIKGLVESDFILAAKVDKIKF